MKTYTSVYAWRSHLLCPSLKNWWHKKSVTFHTDVDRTHRSLCIVQMFFVDLLPIFVRSSDFGITPSLFWTLVRLEIW